MKLEATFHLHLRRTQRAVKSKTFQNYFLNMFYFKMYLANVGSG